MQDLETESLWSQVTGECISGPLKGSRLIPFSTFHTSYAEFKETYPQGVLLKKPTLGDQGSRYDSYFKDKNKLGIFGRLDSFEKLDGKDMIVEKSNPPVIMYYNSQSKTVTAYVLPEKLTKNKIIIKANQMLNAEDDDGWNLITGKSISTDTNDLQRVPVITAYWFAWISFFPDSELIK